MILGNQSKPLEAQFLFWSTADPSTRAVGTLFGLFGYWQVGAIEILRFGWGAVELTRVGSCFGLRVLGFALASWRAPRGLSRFWTNA